MQNPHPSPYFLGEVYGKCRVCFPQLLHSPQNTGLGIVIHSKSEAGNWSLGNLFIYSNGMTFYFGSFGFLMSDHFKTVDLQLKKQKTKNKWLMKVKVDANYGSCFTLISY